MSLDDVPFPKPERVDFVDLWANSNLEDEDIGSLNEILEGQLYLGESVMILL
jgi:hypothetical protein